MCGIAGILGSDALATQGERQINAMLRALKHRGPDDEGLWHNSSSTVRLAHARLSILDLSPAGHQPMHGADGRFTIVFNGEIYNFLELRAGLENDGAVFRTRTDTEVILHLYERHGLDCVRQLRGMFAFAIWDERERTCFLARGPFGIKPLYFAAQNGTFAFASELRALQASGLAGKTLNPAALAAYFESGSVPEPLTLLKDVSLLETGHSLLWKDGVITRKRFWSISFPENDAPSGDAAAFTRGALLDSVEHHFVSDVPVGIFLSGGVDSTALVALGRALGKRDLHTYSIGVNDPALDESSAARRTAEHFGTQHHELRLDDALGMDMFGRFLESVDQPSIDGLNTYAVSWFARQNGAKVVLSGLGGDEIFGGYSTFQRVPSLWRCARLLRAMPGGRTAFKLLLRSGKLPPQLQRLEPLLSAPLTLGDACRIYRGINTRNDAAKLAMHFTGCSPDETKHEWLEPDAGNVSDAMSELELSRYMRNQLLKDSDVMSMAHGLELRVPFVDSALFSAVSRLPASVRLRPGKKLLLDAVPEIPEWVRNQPKRGFLFPYAQWLETPRWKGLFTDSLKNLPVSTPAWYQRWSVFVFEYWRRKHEMINDK